MPHFSAAGTATAIMAALLAAVASFLTADLVIYPRYGNIPAVAADVLVSGIVLAEMSFIAETPLSLPGMAVILIIIAAGEWYFHTYLKRVVFSRPGRKR